MQNSSYKIIRLDIGQKFILFGNLKINLIKCSKYFIFGAFDEIFEQFYFNCCTLVISNFFNMLKKGKGRKKRKKESRRKKESQRKKEMK